MEEAPTKVTWLASSEGTNLAFAVFGGLDVVKGLDKGSLLIARAPHENGMIIGSYVKGESSGALIPYFGKAILKEEFQVLTAPPDALSWVECEGCKVPSNAVIGGQHPNGDVLHIGRVTHKGSVIVGTVHKRYGMVYIPHDGWEHSYNKYEVLVINSLGMLLGV